MADGFFSVFFSWGDNGIEAVKRLDAISSKVDKLLETLKSLKQGQEKMALDFTALAAEIAKIADVKASVVAFGEALKAEIAELKAGFSNVEDQAKVDAFAADLHAGLDSIAAAVATDPLANPPVVVDEPVVDAPVVDAPVVDEPVVEAPVVDAPVVDEPVVEAPVVDEPVVETPVEPVVEAPVVDEVVTEPVVEAPVEPVVDVPAEVVEAPVEVAPEAPAEVVEVPAEVVETPPTE